jgi:hypothetical protein
MSSVCQRKTNIEFVTSASLKRKRKFNSKARQQSAPISTSHETPTPSLRPLLLLVGYEKEKSLEESSFNLSDSFIRPRTSPSSKATSAMQRRANPLMSMLNGVQTNSNNSIPSQQPAFESTSFLSSSSMLTMGSRKLVQGKFVTNHKASELEVYYRMALQNQTAYKSVEKTQINQRKLLDKQFASQHRALQGSVRSAGLAS